VPYTGDRDIYEQERLLYKGGVCIYITKLFDIITLLFFSCNDRKYGRALNKPDNILVFLSPDVDMDRSRNNVKICQMISSKPYNGVMKLSLPTMVNR